MRILLLNQCFYPDVVATAQHLADLALGLKNAGHEVTVITSRRGYDNPRLRFLDYEVWNGIKIFRVHGPGMGKGAKWRRAVDFMGFFVSSAWKLLFMPRQDLVVSLTSPPLISVVATLFKKVRGGKLAIWVMDLNPDEAIAYGWVKPESFTGRILNATAAYALNAADHLVVLDRFMRDRVTAKGVSADKITIIPPWPHNDEVAFDSKGREQFRAEHGINGHFTVMYSGNLSPCHPVDTLLNAAKQLQSRNNILFYFIGGGSEFKRVRKIAAEQDLQNVHCLPYQPMHALSSSLSSADMHVVVMGDAFVGIKHPCKIYNILWLGSDFLYIGPRQSHVTDLMQLEEPSSVGHLAVHGDTEAVVEHILKSSELFFSGTRGRISCLPEYFSKNRLLPKMIDALMIAAQS